MEQERVQENVSGASQLRALEAAQRVKGIEGRSSGLIVRRLQVQKPGRDSASLGRGLRRVLLGCRSAWDWNRG